MAAAAQGRELPAAGTVARAARRGDEVGGARLLVSRDSSTARLPARSSVWLCPGRSGGRGCVAPAWPCLCGPAGRDGPRRTSRGARPHARGTTGHGAAAFLGGRRAGPRPRCWLGPSGKATRRRRRRRRPFPLAHPPVGKKGGKSQRYATLLRLARLGFYVLVQALVTGRRTTPIRPLRRRGRDHLTKSVVTRLPNPPYLSR